MDPTLTTSSDGHLSNGKFAPGNKWGRGCPLNRRRYELRKALLDAATPERVRGVAETLGRLAEEGDVSAAKVYLEFVIGKPPAAVELTGADGAPIGMEWARVESVILGCLSDHPEIRAKLAVQLRAMVTDARLAGQTGDPA